MCIFEEFDFVDRTAVLNLRLSNENIGCGPNY